MRILSATVRLDRGRWFVAFQVEQRNELVRVARPAAAAGIDLGITSLAALADSDGNVSGEPNPRHLDRAQRQLARASRVVSRRRGPRPAHGAKCPPVGGRRRTGAGTRSITGSRTCARTPSTS